MFVLPRDMALLRSSLCYHLFHCKPGPVTKRNRKLVNHLLRRWVRKEQFRAALLDARRESFQQAVGLASPYALVAVAAKVRPICFCLSFP